MANASHSEKNRIRTFGGLAVTRQTNCPIVAGGVGLWLDASGVFKLRNADGTDTLPTSANTLDANPAHIAPLGPALVAGAVGKAADSGHVHQADKAAFRVAYFTGVDASGGAAHVTVAALKAGDQVLFLFNITDGVDGSASFEGTVTVNGQLQQPALNLGTKHFFACFIAKS